MCSSSNPGRSTTIKKIMRNILYFITFILIAIWVVAYFGFGASGIIHVLPVMAFIALMLRVIDNKNYKP